MNWPENAKIKTSYVDLWPFLHPNDPGYTRPAKNQDPPLRFDRIFVKLSTLKVASMNIIGQNDFDGSCEDCLRKGRQKCKPSDHYGLVAKLSKGFGFKV